MKTILLRIIAHIACKVVDYLFHRYFAPKHPKFAAIAQFC